MDLNTWLARVVFCASVAAGAGLCFTTRDEVGACDEVRNVVEMGQSGGLGILAQYHDVLLPDPMPPLENIKCGFFLCRRRWVYGYDTYWVSDPCPLECPNVSSKSVASESTNLERLCREDEGFVACGLQMPEAEVRLAEMCGRGSCIYSRQGLDSEGFFS